MASTSFKRLTETADQKRVVLAFLITPWFVPFIVSFMLYWTLRSGNERFSVGGLLIFIIVVSFWAVPLAYLTEAVLGWPIWKIFERYSIRSLSAFALAGAVIGAIGLLGIRAVNNVPNEPINFMAPWSSPDFLSWTVGASLSAVIFRTIVFYRRSPSSGRG